MDLVYNHNSHANVMKRKCNFIVYNIQRTVHLGAQRSKRKEKLKNTRLIKKSLQNFTAQPSLTPSKLTEAQVPGGSVWNPLIHMLKEFPHL